MREHCRLLAALALMAMAMSVSPALAWEPEEVTITSALASKGPFTAQLLRPQGRRPVPDHRRAARLRRPVQPRGRPGQARDRLGRSPGRRRLCRAVSRQLHGARRAPDLHGARPEDFPKDRADDVAAAVEWLAKTALHRQQPARPDGLVARGHDHAVGGAAGFMTDGPQFKAAIAFYPGCREIAKLDDWRPRVPLKILIGAADDWTQPGPCRELARAHRLQVHRISRRLPRLRRAQLQGARAQGPRRREERRSACRHRSGGARRRDQGGHGHPREGFRRP